MKNQNVLQSLPFIKATAWVMLGISNMFSANDLTVAQNENYWFSTVIRFGMALIFLLAGIYFQKNPTRNVFLLIIVLLLDVVVSTRSPVGIFDGLMLLFDLIFFWLIFAYLKQNKL